MFVCQNSIFARLYGLVGLLGWYDLWQIVAFVGCGPCVKCQRRFFTGQMGLTTA